MRPSIDDECLDVLHVQLVGNFAPNDFVRYDCEVTPGVDHFTDNWFSLELGTLCPVLLPEAAASRKIVPSRAEMQRYTR